VPDSESPSGSELSLPADYRQGPFNRISQVLSSFGGHLRLQMTRTGSIDTSSFDRIRISSPTNPTIPYPEALSSSDKLVASPQSSPSLGAIFDGGVSIPPPRPPLPRPSPPRALTQRSRSPTLSRHPLTDFQTVDTSPARSRVTYDSAASASSDRRPASESNGIPPDAPVSSEHLRNGNRSTSAFPRRAQTTEPSPLRLRRDSSSSSSFRAPFRHRTIDADAAPSESKPLPDRRDKETEKSALAKFLKDLPHWLHVRSSSGGAPDDAEHAIKTAHEGGRRRMKGEVVCLHYGTIDDAGWVRSKSLHV
jgi:hypothetical protein